MDFFDLITPGKANQIIERNIDISKDIEEVKVTESLNRITAKEVIAPEDLPAFTKSAMDGYALQAKDTFGVNEEKPKILDLAGRVEMGAEPEVEIKTGQAVEIPTGGMLPPGADAVVMVEDTESKEDRVKIYDSVSPGENLITKGSDIKQGKQVLPQDHCLRAQDVGALIGLGIEKVEVYQKPKVGIISTGDELIPPGEKLNPGEIRDINTYSLSSLVEEVGAVSINNEIVEDNFTSLKLAIEELITKVDFLLISGGSSVGDRDVTYDVLDELGTEGVLLHGIAVKPGKPTIFTMVNEVPVYGMPGHPVSAMVIFKKFVAPYIRKKLNINNRQADKIEAECTQNVSSAPGREDYLRVKLEETTNGLMAKPIQGESNLIMTMVEADGLVKIPLAREGLVAGEQVEVELFY